MFLERHKRKVLNIININVCTGFIRLLSGSGGLNVREINRNHEIRNKIFHCVCLYKIVKNCCLERRRF